MKVLIFALLLVQLIFACCSDGEYGNMYLLEVSSPPRAGRIESKCVREIYNLITNTEGITTLFAVKELGNSKLLAVLDVKNPTAWPILEDGLSRRAVMFSTVPLVSCSRFATELNVNLSNYNMNFKNPVTHLYDSTQLSRGESEDEHNTIVMDSLKSIQQIFSSNGWDVYCFKVTADTPIRIVSFTNQAANSGLKMAFQVRSVERYHMTMRMVHDLTR